MSGNWFTDRLPWRFFVPRPRYLRNLTVAEKVPEIKGQINRQAALKLAEYVFYVLWSPVFLVVFILFVLHWLLGLFLQPGRIPITPPFDDWQREAVEEAWSIVPLDVVQERLGEQTRILSKKSDLPS